jgi:hypothetical protein
MLSVSINITKEKKGMRWSPCLGLASLLKINARRCIDSAQVNDMISAYTIMTRQEQTKTELDQFNHN